MCLVCSAQKMSLGRLDMLFLTLLALLVIISMRYNMVDDTHGGICFAQPFACNVDLTSLECAWNSVWDISIDICINIAFDVSMYLSMDLHLLLYTFMDT